MSDDYKKIFLIIFFGFFLVFLAGFQIAFINRFSWRFNIFLVLTLYLILTKNIYSAVFSALFGGLLIDTSHFSIFGISSLTLLILTVFLIFFQKKALLTAKTEGILLISAISVIFYHFFEIILNSIFTMGQEKLSFYFLNTAMAMEFILSTALLLLIFQFKSRQNV